MVVGRVSSVQMPARRRRRAGTVASGGVGRVDVGAHTARPGEVWSPSGEATKDDARARVAPDADGSADLAAVLSLARAGASATGLERLRGVEALHRSTVSNLSNHWKIVTHLESTSARDDRREVAHGREVLADGHVVRRGPDDRAGSLPTEQR